LNENKENNNILAKMSFEIKRETGFKNSKKINIPETKELYFKITDYPEEIIIKPSDAFLEKNSIPNTFFSIVENSHEGIVIFKEDFTILYINNKFCEIFQTEPNVFLYHDFRKFLSGQMSEIISKKIETIKFSSNSLSNYRLKIEQKNGNFLFLEVNLIFLSDPEGQNLIVGQLLDYTGKKSVEDELLKAKEKAEEADKLKSEFLAQISHEIRTPINTLMSFAELIGNELDSVVSDDLRTGFEMMQRAGKRIIRTTDMILNMSEIHLGIYEPNLCQIDLFNDVIKVLCDEFKIIAKEKHLSFSINRATQISEIIGDEFTLMQIFRSLLDNAFKFTFFGKVEINIFKLNGEQLTVEVRDTGIGISNEYLPNLFNTFSQEEQGYTRKFDGTGLGLALVKQYCKINNAKIEVESKKGFGSNFRVIFN